MQTTAHACRPGGEEVERLVTADEPCVIVAIAWPTCRPVYAYTVEEVADGVDVYTRAMKARAAALRRGHHDDH